MKRKISQILYASVKKRKIFLLEKRINDFPFRLKTKVKINVQIFYKTEFNRIANKFIDFRVNISNLLRNSDICAIAEINEKLVHWSFVAFKEAMVKEIERRVKLNPGSAYLYAVYTLPRHRNMGIAHEVIYKILCHLRERGIKAAYVIVGSDNLPMLKLAFKLGFKKIGNIKFIKLWKFKLYRCYSKTKKDYIVLRELLSL
jgi:ribosomal protein S18 acetylase RimI-like enzyme